MEDKSAKERGKMNKQEFLLNKPLLKEINDKKKVSGYGGSIQRGEDSRGDALSEYQRW